MSLSNFLESAILTHVMSTYTVHVAYGTASASEDGSTAAEPAGGGYARKAFGLYTVTFTGDDYYAENDADIDFAEATADQGLITHVYFFDAITAGNFLGEVSFADLGQSDISVITGTTVSFPAGDCKLTME